MSKRQAMTTTLPGLRDGRCEYENCRHVASYVCPACHSEICARETSGGGATLRQCRVCRATFPDDTWNATGQILTERRHSQREAQVQDIVARARRVADPTNPYDWWCALDAAIEHVTHRPSAPLAGLREPLQTLVADARSAFIRSVLCTAIVATETTELSRLINDAGSTNSVGGLDGFCIEIIREEYADRTAAFICGFPTEDRIAANF